MSGRSGALRAAIFGANDGLVSNLSPIMGVAGAGAGNDVVILAGVAGLLAGAFSMAAGEYISMRVQREVFERLIHLEAHEIGSDHAGERAELAELYRRKGISAELADRLAEELMRDPELALETHAREELGLDPGEGARLAVGRGRLVVRGVRGRGARAPDPVLVRSGGRRGDRLGGPVHPHALRDRLGDVIPHRAERARPRACG